MNHFNLLFYLVLGEGLELIRKHGPGKYYRPAQKEHCAEKDIGEYLSLY
jgi:hypothetical protein